MLRGGLGLAGLGVLAACAGGPRSSTPAPGSIGPVPPASPSPGQKVVEASLSARPTTLDLGGTTVQTWAYGDTVPGPLIRASAGDFLQITLDNQLPDDTTIHWHGIRLRNAADGVPGMTQDPIKPGGQYVYQFTAPDPGTYFFHPHVGVQLDRGLYAPLIIDDPAEPGAYDAEWVLVLDDWIDGTGTTPDDVLQDLLGGSNPQGSGSGGQGPMGGMNHGGIGMGAPPWGDAGDVQYPHYLINGKIPSDPTVLEAKPGQRVRIRFISAAADTIFTVALGGHKLTVTHSDGFGVQPTETDAFYIGMGERYDVEVTLGDGAFPLVAVPFGKPGQTMAIVRTAAGAVPPAGSVPVELGGAVLNGAKLLPTDAARLPSRNPTAAADLVLNGQMQPYTWGINGAPYGKNEPLTVGAGERLRLKVVNMTMMSHPLHVHGHTFALAGSGLRKDTVLLAPMQSTAIDLEADNAGDWMIHCHNIYHAEAGMMIALSYTS